MTAIATEAPAASESLRRAREGDHDAFAALVEEHEAMVFSIALRFFGDRARAEELAQDVFLRLYRSLASIESESHLVLWLRQVTTRRCIDDVRHFRLRAVSLDEVGEPAARHETGDPLLRRKLRKLVAALPAAQRLIVTLRYQEDLDPAEICRVVGLPVNTVKSHLHRAIVALRRELGDR